VVGERNPRRKGNTESQCGWKREVEDNCSEGERHTLVMAKTLEFLANV
jgi:hypothetical protein